MTTKIDPTLASPSSLDAEKGVLSCMLLDPLGVLPQVRGVLKAESFHLPAHRLIFDLLLEKADAREPIEPVSIQQTLLDRHKMDEVGGPGTLLELFNFCPVAAHWDYYADIVADKAARRTGMDQMSVLWKAFCETDTDWRSTVATAQGFLSELLAGRQKKTAVPYSEVMRITMDELEFRMVNQGKIVGGLLTGLTDLDRMFMGLSNPSIVTIAGRPSMGKSVLLLGIAERIASGWGDYEEYDPTPRRVLFISTEMNYPDLGARSVSSRSGVNIKRFTDGFVPQDDFQRTIHAAGELALINLHVHYLPGATAEGVASYIHAWDSQHPDTAAYVIDHMTDVGCEAVKDKGNQTAITSMAWQIVTDAIKRVNKVGILGCQLSRENSGRLPQLSDLKGSTKIEEVSSHVVFIHRPHYYELRKEHPDPDVDPCAAILMIAKNRNGRCGPIGAWFDADITRFRSETRRLYSLDRADRQEKQTYANQ